MSGDHDHCRVCGDDMCRKASHLSMPEDVRLVTDLLNEFGDGRTIHVRHATAMAKSGKIKHWRQALTTDWRGVRGIGKTGLAMIEEAKNLHANNGEQTQ